MRFGVKISVLIPTYHRGQLLAATLHSALTQTWSELEIIVIDDASTDDTYAVACSVQDARLRVVRHMQNLGVSAALNTGIQAAQGDLIAILEHDDIWLPEKLARQIPLFDNPEVGLVYCGVAMVAEEGEIGRTAPLKRGDIYEELLFKSYITTSSSVVVRRACFEQAGLFDETLHGTQDYDMWIRIARHYKVDFVPDVLVNFAAYRHLRLNSPSRLALTYRLLTKKFESYWYPSPLLRRQVLAYRRYSLADLLGATGDTAQAQREYWASLRMWPWTIKGWVGLTATVLGPQLYGRFALWKEQALLAWQSQRARQARGRA
jgi:glycosyltransferase involved in cell wall biosynthesis